MNREQWKEIITKRLVDGNTVDHGNNGKMYESLVKLCFGNIRGRMVSIASRVDTRKFHHTFEIKSNCGELAVLDEYGNITKSILNKDFVIYCPTIETVETFDTLLNKVLYETVVVPSEEFWNGLEMLGLIRQKRSSAGLYMDRLTIQSYKNSKKKFAALMEFLNEYELFVDYLEENGITMD